MQYLCPSLFFSWYCKFSRIFLVNKIFSCHSFFLLPFLYLHPHPTFQSLPFYSLGPWGKVRLNKLLNFLENQHKYILVWVWFIKLVLFRISFHIIKLPGIVSSYNLQHKMTFIQLGCAVYLYTLCIWILCL